eukprot:1279076-Pleurochrysis_carterae.AAC.1
MPGLPPPQQPVGKKKGRGVGGRGKGRDSPLLRALACRAACLPVVAASLFLAPVAPVVLLLCLACASPMRLLVHASGDRMFGLSLHGA